LCSNWGTPPREAGDFNQSPFEESGTHHNKKWEIHCLAITGKQVLLLRINDGLCIPCDRYKIPHDWGNSIAHHWNRKVAEKWCDENDDEI